MKYLIVFLTALGLLAALTLYAGAQSSSMTSGYFGGSTGGGNASWSISRGNEAPKQARPQRIKQPRR